MNKEIKSVADLLKQAINELDARKERAAELATNSRSERERTAELWKRIHSLPQHERRQVLDAAGLKHVSAAPPPIQPIAGRGSFTPRRPDAIKPKWDEWRMLGVVLPWEAAALSINLDPRSVNQWKRDTFPSDELFSEFEMRKRTISSNGAQIGGNQVNLVLFADHAASIGMDIPAELAALAQHTEVLKAAAKIKAAENDGDVSPHDQPSSLENNNLAQFTSHPKEKRGISKSEILAVDWPLPNEAPDLENILNKLPKWADEACLKIGSAGKGSHLWNPAQLAVCLATTTPQKKWSCKQPALDKFIRANFSEYFDEWDGYKLML